MTAVRTGCYKPAASALYTAANGTESESDLSAAARVVEPQQECYRTAYERLSYDLANDKRCQKEVTLGKRIGFYCLRGQLGCGNFSQVKLGIHVLTKGECVFVVDESSVELEMEIYFIYIFIYFYQTYIVIFHTIKQYTF